MLQTILHEADDTKMDALTDSQWRVLRMSEPLAHTALLDT